MRFSGILEDNVHLDNEEISPKSGLFQWRNYGVFW